MASMKRGNVAFSVSVTPDKRKKTEEDEFVVAILAPFNPFPIVCFENKKLHRPSERSVILRNPNKTSLQVALTKLPEDRGFEWSATEFDIPAENQVVLSISWTPTEYGNWRDSIKIVNKKTKRNIFDIILVTSTEAAPKVTKKCLKSQSQNKTQLKTVGNDTVVKATRSRANNKENVSQNVTYSVSKSSKHLDTVGILMPKSPGPMEKNMLKLPVAVSTPRRTTYEVPTSCSSVRRSTYSLRPKPFLNILELENEKESFDKIASPVLSKSFENAASKLVENAIGAFNSETNNVEPVSSTPERTFVIPHVVHISETVTSPQYRAETSNGAKPMFSTLGTTFVVPQDCKISETISSDHHLRRTTYEVFESVLPSVSESVVASSDQKAVRLSLESVTSSAAFYDSLESNNTESKDNINFDQFDFDNISLNSNSPENRAVSCKESEGNLRTEIICPPNSSAESLLNSEFSRECVKDLLNCKPISSLISEPEIKVEVSVENNVFSAPHHELDQKPLRNSSTTDPKSRFYYEVLENDNLSNFSTTPQHNQGNRDFSGPSYSRELYKQEFISNEANVASVNDMATKIEIETLDSPINQQLSSGLEIKNEEGSDSTPNHLGSMFTRITLDASLSDLHSFNPGSTHTNEPTPSLYHSSPEVLTKEAGPHKPIIWDISPPKTSKIPECISSQKEAQKHTRSFKISKMSSLKSLPNTELLPVKTKFSLKETIVTPRKVEIAPVSVSVKISSASSESLFVAPKRASSLQRLTANTTPKLRKMTQDLVKVKRLSTLGSAKKPQTEPKRRSIIGGSLGQTGSSSVENRMAKKRKSFKVPEWVPAPARKLRLSCASADSQSDQEQPLTSPVDPAVNPFLAATTLNPFQEGGLYFDEKWLDEQERQLIDWAARMLRPPAELELAHDQSGKHRLHRLTALRQAAFHLLISKEVQTALSKVKVAVEKKVLCIRSDKQLHVDLGLQDKIVNLLMHYNPLWLRLCLEAVYQRNINLNRHSDSVGLINFIRRHLVNDPYIQETCSHPTIPYLMLPEYEEKMKKFTLFKFLEVVYLLDYAKSKKLIRHDPCLFKKESPIKCTKDILIEFNKDFISGTGDLTRLLQRKGYEVAHSQTFLNEFDFTLTNRSELRDGVRLTKLAEILTGDTSYCQKLRVPAISSLQKKFNCDLAFTALKNNGVKLPEDVFPKDISDGHKEKTLSFLWHLKGGVEQNAVVIIIKRWRETKPVRQARKEFLKKRSCIIKIQRWYRKKKAENKLTKEEMKRGKEDRERFLKLKSSAILLQRKFRMKKDEQNKRRRNYAACKIQNWFRNNKATKLEREILNSKKNSVIYIQRFYRNYKKKQIGLNCKDRQHFINLKRITVKIQEIFRKKMSRKVQAALVLQRWFRACIKCKFQRERFLQIKKSALVVQQRFKANKLCKNKRMEFLNIKSATITIQIWYRAKKRMQADRNRYTKLKGSAIMIQRSFRATLLAQEQRRMYLKIKLSSVVIQKWYRANKLMQADINRYNVMKKAVVKIQRTFRATKIVHAQQEEYLKLKKSTIVIQRWYRANKLMQADKSRYNLMKQATVKVQQFFRATKIGHAQRQEYLKLKSSTIMIQRWYRANKLLQADIKRYNVMKQAIVKIQRTFRATKIAHAQREEYLKLKKSTIIIQRWYRANKLMQADKSTYNVMKQATVKIQQFFRATKIGHAQKQEYLKLKSSTIMIQRWYRANKLLQADINRYNMMKQAVVKIQRTFRATKIAHAQREEYLKLKKSTIVIQRWYRANKLMQADKSRYNLMKQATVKVQQFFRATKIGHAQRQEYLKLKSSTIMIQRWYRANKLLQADIKRYNVMKQAVVKIQRTFRATKIAHAQREEYLKLKKSTIIIQRWYRANKLMQADKSTYNVMKQATVKIQQFFRATKIGHAQKQEYLKLKSSTIMIQRWYRANKLLQADINRYNMMKQAVVKIQRTFRATKIAHAQREEYLKLKKSTIIIQRWYRANKLMQADKSTYNVRIQATVKIQQFFRATKIGHAQRQEYLKLKSSTIMIQRWYRANKLLQADINRYNVMKQVVVKIQRSFRATKIAHAQRQEYLKLKSSTTMIQRWYRANRLLQADIKRYNVMKQAVVKIQRTFRATKIAHAQREEYLKLKKSTIIIQRWYRANKLMQADKSRYNVMKQATVKIQQFFRATKIGHAQRQEYLKLKSSTIMIQRWYRANKLLQADINRYNVIKQVVVKIQRSFRATKIAHTQQEEYLKLKKSTIIIQRWYRANKLMRADKNRYTVMKQAVVNIQRSFRATRIAHAQREKYLKLKSSAIIIQRRYRAKRLMQADRNMYIKLKDSVIRIQRCFRARLLAQDQRSVYLKMKLSAVVIQRWYRANKLLQADINRKSQEQISFENVLKKKIIAVTKVQAFWRGVMTRRKVVVPKPVVKDAPESGKGTIANRARHLLPYVADFSKCTVSELQICLFNLDTLTVLSLDQCRFFVSEGVVKNLYSILDASNRAVGVDKCIERALLSLGNMYRAPDTAYTVWQETLEMSGEYLLADIMMRFRTAKNPSIFCNAATVIWLFAQDAEKATTIMKNPKAARIIRYLAKDMKKTTKPPPTASTSRKVKPSGCNTELPSTVPNWGMYFNAPRAFTDRTAAWSCVCKVLNI